MSAPTIDDLIFRPWKVIDHSNESRGGYIEVRGANDESICQLFPLAGKGGVGVEAARRIARAIVDATREPYRPANPQPER